jgi:hypothetical protein
MTKLTKLCQVIETEDKKHREISGKMKNIKSLEDNKRGSFVSFVKKWREKFT